MKALLAAGTYCPYCKKAMAIRARDNDGENEYVTSCVNDACEQNDILYRAPMIELERLA